MFQLLVVLFIIFMFCFAQSFICPTIFSLNLDVVGDPCVAHLYFFAVSSNKGSFDLRFNGLWLKRFSCLSLLLLSIKFLPQVATRQVNNTFPILTGAMIKIATSFIKTYSFERNHATTRTSQMKKEFEMQCNVFKMKYTVELNSKLPRNVA